MALLSSLEQTRAALFTFIILRLFDVGLFYREYVFKILNYTLKVTLCALLGSLI